MTPPPDDAWTPPERPEPAEPVEPGEPVTPEPEPSQRPAYGSPQSPSYGRYGQGQAEPPASQPPAPPYGQPQYGPPEQGERPYGSQAWGPPPGQSGLPPGQSPPELQPYGQPPHGYPGQPAWAPGPSAFSAGRLGTPVIVLSSLVTASLWVTAAMSPSADRALERAVADGTSLNDALAPYSVVSAISVPIWIGAWVLTSIWLGRAHRNAALVRPGGQRRAPVWCWLGWVVPLVMFWFPQQILDDTLRATTEPFARQTQHPYGSTPPPLAAWQGTAPYWAAWVGLNVLNGVDLRLSQLAAPEDSIVPGLAFAVAIVATIALALWIPLVRRISAAQDQLSGSGR